MEVKSGTPALRFFQQAAPMPLYVAAGVLQ
jgi:hypothetical protein